LTDVWKKNLLEDLKLGEVEFRLVREFLLELKKKFGKGDEELVKVAELRRIGQGGKTMKEFIQKFKRAVRGSRYKERVFVEEFKRKMNKVIRRKLMEVERPPTNIK